MTILRSNRVNALILTCFVLVATFLVYDEQYYAQPIEQTHHIPTYTLLDTFDGVLGVSCVVYMPSPDSIFKYNLVLKPANGSFPFKLEVSSVEEADWCESNNNLSKGVLKGLTLTDEGLYYYQASYSGKNSQNVDSFTLEAQNLYKVIPGQEIILGPPGKEYLFSSGNAISDGKSLILDAVTSKDLGESWSARVSNGNLNAMPPEGAYWLNLLNTTDQTSDFVLMSIKSERFETNSLVLKLRAETTSENFETEYYKVKSANNFQNVAVSDLSYSSYYPTNDPSDYSPPSAFGIEIDKFAVTDLNLDGYQDLVTTWGIFPHLQSHNFSRPISVWLNDTKGSLLHTDKVFEAGAPPEWRDQAYRIESSDLNLDGYPDLVVAIRASEPPYLPILVMMSNGNGKLVEYTSQIQRENTDTSAIVGHKAHDLSLIDIDNDGFKDIYSSGVLWRNESGNEFRIRNDLIPIELTGSSQKSDDIQPSIMTSSSGDFNGDGIDDLAAFYFDDNYGLEGSSTTGFIAMSGIGPGLNLTRSLVSAPDGFFGNGQTKFNDSVTEDFNGDGFADLALAVTSADPYYQGKILQIFISNGDGTFSYEPARVQSEDWLKTTQGESQLEIVDANNDGYRDIVHYGPSNDRNAGVVIYLNDGMGHFKQLSESVFAKLDDYELDGMPFWAEAFRRENPVALTTSIPINIDNVGGIDLFVQKTVPWSLLSETPRQLFSSQFFYQVMSKPGTAIPTPR